AEHIAVLITVKALIIKGDFQEAEKICQSKLLEFEYYGLPLLTLYLKLFKSICKFYFGDFKQAEELCLNAINMIKTTDIEKSYTLPFAENAVFLKDILLTLSKKTKDKETDDFIKQIFEICNITYDKITIKYKQLLVKKANNQYSYLNVDKGLSFKQSPLSDREKEVIALLSKGLTREEISKSLFISQSTVKTYLNN
ncbi:MAG: helix-turn-helix transcriptional regulator, partial [Oscillospiraceae bacterium]